MARCRWNAQATQSRRNGAAHLFARNRHLPVTRVPSSYRLLFVCACRTHQPSNRMKKAGASAASAETRDLAAVGILTGAMLQQYWRALVAVWCRRGDMAFTAAQHRAVLPAPGAGEGIGRLIIAWLSDNASALVNMPPARRLFTTSLDIACRRRAVLRRGWQGARHQAPGACGTADEKTPSARRVPVRLGGMARWRTSSGWHDAQRRQQFCRTGAAKYLAHRKTACRAAAAGRLTPGIGAASNAMALLVRRAVRRMKKKKKKNITTGRCVLNGMATLLPAIKFVYFRGDACLSRFRISAGTFRQPPATYNATLLTTLVSENMHRA